jgi:hypothetical protein
MELVCWVIDAMAPEMLDGTCWLSVCGNAIVFSSFSVVVAYAEVGRAEMKARLTRR